MVQKISLHAGSYDDLGQCGPEDMVKIARDLGLPASDLRALTVKAPDGANAVSTMLRALSMDPAVLAVGDPATMRDLQRTCILCERKGRCRDEFAKDTAAWHFREFCPPSRINKSLRPARLPHDHRMPLLRVGRRAAICRSAAGLSQHKERAGSPPTMHSKKHEGGKGNSHETPERQK
jgi:hypothetical protein